MKITMRYIEMIIAALSTAMCVITLYRYNIATGGIHPMAMFVLVGTMFFTLYTLSQ